MNKNLKIALIAVSVCFSVGIIGLVSLVGLKYVGSNVRFEGSSSSSSEMYPTYDIYGSPEAYVTSSDYFESNVESKIKKNGYIDLLVDSLGDSSENVLSLMSSYSGELVSSYETGTGNYRYISITLKVESKDFESLYSELRNIGGEVLSSSYSTEDVTMEYTDLESTLRNLKATETQLLNILNQADTVTETLEVYRELTNIRFQIEITEGRIKYLDNQVDFSYITVNLSLSDSGRDIVSSKWQPVGVFKNALSALVSLGKYMLNFLIWVLVFSPVLGLIAGIVLFTKKRVNKKA